MADLTGKVAFITGAARGQGRAHAIELAKAGADIIALDVADADAAFGLGYPLATAEELATTAKEVEALDRRIVTAAVDVRNAEALTDALQNGVNELGRLDIVVANAGIAPGPTPIQDTVLENWQQVLDVNLTGVFNTCKAAIPHLIQAGGGAMVLTSSIASMYTHAGLGCYTVAKSGVVALMKTLAKELAPHSIRVNTIHPSQVDTLMIMNDELFRIFRPDVENPTKADFEEASQGLHALPLTVFQPRDIARAVLFLVSDDAKYITGVSLPLDAGMLVK
ncbi:mycofactocin-coupled SDR family oxidoreductase [Pseudonocardia sp. 73-21]|uniref:mycofactocin-coupled SDR family oxidoreductase n=1 Tax=Pseudonocardia sp. 73-21 TaxID=1895809 RepID=UPI0009659E67|nr:mycofactocin-coupled SDR family oxidoreductase [Pseudonocardia sp. 73-21]OJY38753.1 MAG: 3-ketoacyl-ACP reductase [Pseudonocardia sp. 73-21]